MPADVLRRFLKEIAGLGLFIVISELDVKLTRTKFDTTRPSSGCMRGP